MSQHTTEEYQEIIDTLNTNLPLHSMWDGFWLHAFHQKTLIIAGSFDRMYYRNFDIIFKKVIFFNLPDEWRDTDVPGDDFLRLASLHEFRQQQPDFDTQGMPIFAIDLHFQRQHDTIKLTFYVIAEHVYLKECVYPDSNAATERLDMITDRNYLSIENRVLRVN